MNLVICHGCIGIYSERQFVYKFLKCTLLHRIDDFMNVDVLASHSTSQRILTENPVIGNRGSKTKEAEMQQN